MSERCGRVGALLLVLAAACSGDDGPSRADVMATLADDVGVEFAAFANQTESMSASVDAACAEPSEATVGDARESVRVTRAIWLRTQAMWTGPVMDRRSPSLIDWPVDTAGVDVLVEGADAAELTPELVAGSVGADVRGLRSLGSVLGRDDAVELLADPSWCNYLTSVAATIVDEAKAIEATWTVGIDGEPPFAEVVSDPDDAQEWLAMFVDDNIQLVRLAGRPTDAFEDRVRQLIGVEKVFGTVNNLLDDDLGVAIAQQVIAAKNALRDGDPDEIDAQLTTLDQMLSTDVAGQLDVTIGFSDADGDGSG